MIALICMLFIVVVALVVCAAAAALVIGTTKLAVGAFRLENETPVAVGAYESVEYHEQTHKRINATIREDLERESRLARGQLEDPIFDAPPPDWKDMQ